MKWGRTLAIGWLVGLTTLLACAQDYRPEATVVIKHDASGDLVNIAMLDPQFPTNLLNERIQMLGGEVGVPPRGISVFTQQFGSGEGQRLVKAQFAINGLVAPARGEVNLQAVARMFVGLKEPHRIDAIKVILDGQVPTTQTLRSYSSDAVSVDGQFTNQPPALEYLIYFKSQASAEIKIPLMHTPPPAVPVEKPAPSGPPMNVLILLIVLASVAAGALVYFLMLGRGGNGSPKTPHSRS